MEGSNALQELQSSQHQQQQMSSPQVQIQQQPSSQFSNPSSQEDFLEQMLSQMPQWSQIPSTLKASAYAAAGSVHGLFKDPAGTDSQRYHFDDSSLLASRLRQQQIGGGPQSPTLPHHPGLLPFPLTLGGATDPSDSRLQEVNNPFKSANLSDEGPIQGLCSGLTASLPRAAQAPPPPQQFHLPQAGSISSSHPASAGGGTSGGAQVRPKVRARRGQATDPHSIAERLRRERIAERMKALQELVPNANKTDKASMLDEIIDYVKFLQLQVKVLSMSRLGGAAAVAPLVADISSEAAGRSNTSAANESIAATEQQVAKMMEEDMGSALQYLQGKGLCLMPISLATAISTVNSCHSRNLSTLIQSSNVADAPSSPSMSVLTVQSTIGGEPSVKDNTSVSKP